MINPTLSRVTQRITHRSRASRAAYLARIEAARSPNRPPRAAGLRQRPRLRRLSAR